VTLPNAVSEITHPAGGVISNPTSKSKSVSVGSTAKTPISV